MKKYLPDLLCIFGFGIWLFGILTQHPENKQLVNLILIPSGSIIFGFSGYLIIRAKRYSFGFYEIKGWLAVLYGSLFIFVGLIFIVGFLLSISSTL